MPIPAPVPYRTSNLTEQQRADALAAAYGVDMNDQQLTHEEAARMRQLLARFDSESKPIQTFDLNNPPREPYRYQPFPKMLYGGEGRTLTVANQEQMDQALEEGWSQDASLYQPVLADHLSAKNQREAAEVQTQIDTLKAKRGPRIGRSLHGEVA